MRVLLVCFANTCRSPVAEALLESALGVDSGVEVVSRGLVAGPGEPPAALVAVARARSVELTDRGGVALERHEGRSADLILFMERALLREVVVGDPHLWPRSFTLLEFSRRAFNDPPDRAHEDFAQWLSLLHRGRRAEDLVRDEPGDDVADPGLDGEAADYTRMFDELASAVARIAPFLRGWSSTSA